MQVLNDGCMVSYCLGLGIYDNYHCCITIFQSCGYIVISLNCVGCVMQGFTVCLMVSTVCVYSCSNAHNNEFQTSFDYVCIFA